MANPQQPELRRSELGATVDDSAKTKIQTEGKRSQKGRTGPVPEDNRAGHHPDVEQDQPDGDELAQRLGVRAEPDVDG